MFYFVRSPTEMFLFILELTASDATGFQAFLGQSLGGTGGIKDESGQGTTTAFTEAICAHLGTRALLTPADAKVRIGNTHDLIFFLFCLIEQKCLGVVET